MSRLGIKRGTAIELIVILAAAVGLALVVQAWAVKPYEIPSGSMEPTLAIGQRVLVNRLGTHFGDPDVGDILVFHPPKGAEGDVCGVQELPHQACSEPVDEESDTNFIKRVVALPGDKLTIRNGHPVVNGVQADESFARPCREPSRCDFSEPITIPEDHYFMMGDNRQNSDDSRFWGPVPREWIIGQAFATYWPPSRVGLF